jgi:serine/threonine kinase 38
MEAAFKPEVKNELDTQNFEKFEESGSETQPSSKSGPWRKMLSSSKDVNFVGYTYKNFEIVQDVQVPGVAELRKKGKPKRPSIKTLFDPTDRPNGHMQGSFLCHLPTPMEVSESPESSPPGSISSPPQMTYYQEQAAYPYKSHVR